MTAALDGTDPGEFSVPKDIEFANVDAKPGVSAETIDSHMKGTKPTQRVRVDNQSAGVSDEPLKWRNRYSSPSARRRKRDKSKVETERFGWLCLCAQWRQLPNRLAAIEPTVVLVSVIALQA